MTATAPPRAVVRRGMAMALPGALDSKPKHKRRAPAHRADAIYVRKYRLFPSSEREFDLVTRSKQKPPASGTGLLLLSRPVYPRKR